MDSKVEATARSHIQEANRRRGGRTMIYEVVEMGVNGMPQDGPRALHEHICPYILKREVHLGQCAP